MKNNEELNEKIKNLRIKLGEYRTARTEAKKEIAFRSYQISDIERQRERLNIYQKEQMEKYNDLSEKRARLMLVVIPKLEKEIKKLDVKIFKVNMKIEELTSESATKGAQLGEE